MTMIYSYQLGIMMTGTTILRMMREKFDEDDEKIDILKQVSIF